MKVFLLFTAVSVLCGGTSLILKEHFSRTLPGVCLGISLFLYLFGLFDLLSVGFYAILMLILLCAIYLFYSTVKDHSTCKKIFLCPGFLVFFFFFLLVSWANNNRMLSGWDEFSHWGLTIKNIFMLDTFGNHPLSTTYFKGYPPAASLFLYFGVRVCGIWSEEVLYVAMATLMFIPFIAILSSDGKKKSTASVLLFPGIFLLPLLFFPNGYSSLYVDALLGVLFGYSLFVYFSRETMDRNAWLHLSLPMAFLCLTKSSGLGLAAIALLIMLADTLLCRKQKHTATTKKGWRTVIMYYPVSPLLAILFAHYSWNIFMDFHDIATGSRAGQVTLDKLSALLSGQGEAYQYETWTNFVSAFHNTILNHWSYFGWLCALFGIGILYACFLKNRPGQRKRALILGAGATVGGIVYALSMLTLYLFAFGSYEGPGLASYGRYMGTYILGALLALSMVILADVIEHFCASHPNGILVPILVSLWPLFLVDKNAIASLTVTAPQNIEGSVEFRKLYQMQMQLTDMLNPQTDQVWLISQQNSGIDYWVSRYNLTPVSTQPTITYTIDTIEGIHRQLWSIGTPYGESDIWTSPMTLDEWKDQLTEVTHVYLHHVDEQFIREFGQAFANPEDIGNNRLFQVHQTASDIILELVADLGAQ